MTIRASWHLPELSSVDDDPFAAPIEDVGVPIRLGTSIAEIAPELVGTVDKIKRLKARGVTCAIRDLEETSCNACPLAGQSPRLAALCAVSRRQEELVTLLAILDDHEDG